MTDYLHTPEGRRIAYDRVDGTGTGVVFLHGLKSDMQGTKSVALADWARRTGRPFLRFDCSGHGVSDGKFDHGTIGQWFEDARAAIRELTTGPQILVGSSMGGWLSLLLARENPELVAGVVTIAGAPDFTEDGYWAKLTPAQRDAMVRDGYIDFPSEYADPYRITHALIRDGRERLVLRDPLALPFPTHFLQGAADTVVSVATAQRLFDHATGDDIRLTIVKGSDHRFSSPADLALIETTIENLRIA